VCEFFRGKHANSQRGKRKRKKMVKKNSSVINTFLFWLISLSYYCYKDRSTMTREDDLYRALGLERTASQEEIRKAYKTTGAFYLRIKNFRLSRVFCTQRRGAFHLVQEESARQRRARVSIFERNVARYSPASISSFLSFSTIIL
jgi:hypothetical protein